MVIVKDHLLYEGLHLYGLILHLFISVVYLLVLFSSKFFKPELKQNFTLTFIFNYKVIAKLSQLH